MAQVIWITGLSAAGKTSTAEVVVKQLRARGETAVMLDGDAVREIVRDPNVGHDRASRLANAYRICRLAHFMAKQDLVVVVATMSLFHEIHQWNRENLPGYFEVLIEVDLEILRERDQKGVYGGVDLAVEFPRHPHLTTDNNPATDDRGQIAREVIVALDGPVKAVDQESFRRTAQSVGAKTQG